jgi:uncharacterized protein (DUF1697 family)
MPRYVAFLRAINITGRPVKMDALRREFEAMGFANVATYIQSGNVLFESSDSDTAELESRIEGRVEAMVGYPVATFIRTEAELARLGSFTPFPDSELTPESIMYVAFLRDEPGNAKQEALLAQAGAIDQFQIYGRHVFWLRHTHLGESSFSGARLEKIISGPATVRNMTTIRKIVAKYDLLER